MLKYEEETAFDWMLIISNLFWKEGKMPRDLMKAIVGPVSKEKGGNIECGN